MEAVFFVSPFFFVGSGCGCCERDGRPFEEWVVLANV